MRGLAYAHPALMLTVLGLGLWVLREGLRVRRARLLGRPFDSARHRRAARWLVGLVLAGYASGLLSMAVLRGEPAGRSVHFALASCAAGGLALAGALGLWLERRGGAPIRGVHALAGALGLLSGIAGAAAAWAIFP